MKNLIKSKVGVTAKIVALMLAANITVSCTNKTAGTKNMVTGNMAKAEDCNYELNGVRLTKLFNPDMGTLKQLDDAIVFTAKKGSDYFSDPQGQLSNFTAPMLMTELDNTKPFTVTVKVEPEFNPATEGVYSAGTVIIYADNSHWQKICYEQDEAGAHRLITMRTVGLSDDVNHEISEAKSLWLRLSSDTRIIGNYYSKDGEHWQLLRDYANDYPERLYIGIMSQCPQDSIHTCRYSDMELVYQPVKDFRTGDL